MADYLSILDTADCEEKFFAVALRLPAAQRPTLLNVACVDSPQLRQRLEALLKAHAEAGDLLEFPGKAAGAGRSARMRAPVRWPAGVIKSGCGSQGNTVSAGGMVPFPSPQPSPSGRGSDDDQPAAPRTCELPDVAPAVPSPRGAGQGEGKGRVHPKTSYPCIPRNLLYPAHPFLTTPLAGEQADW